MALAKAAQPAGPYTRLMTVVEPWAHNPQVTRDAQGRFLLYTLGNGVPVKPEQNCMTGADKVDETEMAVLPPGAGVVARNETTVSITMHWADTITGPWHAQNISIVNFPTNYTLKNT